jgi:hypothetical protein
MFAAQTDGHDFIGPQQAVGGHQGLISAIATGVDANGATRIARATTHLTQWLATAAFLARRQVRAPLEIGDDRSIRQNSPVWLSAHHGQVDISKRRIDCNGLPPQSVTFRIDRMQRHSRVRKRAAVSLMARGSGIVPRAWGCTVTLSFRQEAVAQAG